MAKIFTILLTIFLTLLASEVARAGPRFSVLGGVHKSLADPYAEIFTGESFTPALGYQAGLELGIALGSVFQLDAGGFYLHSRTKVAVGGAEGAILTTNQVQTPLQLRVRVTRAISVAGGAFYGFHMTGNADDYGYLAGLRVSFGSVFLDGRYAGGLKEVAGENSQRWLALLGFSFGGGKRR